jgi:hypothetical protein
MTEKGEITVHLDMENPVPQVLDDSAFCNPMKGILIATSLSLLMWAGIILALSKLF